MGQKSIAMNSQFYKQRKICVKRKTIILECRSTIERKKGRERERELLKLVFCDSRDRIVRGWSAFSQIFLFCSFLVNHLHLLLIGCRGRCGERFWIFGCVIEWAERQRPKKCCWQIFLFTVIAPVEYVQLAPNIFVRKIDLCCTIVAHTNHTDHTTIASDWRIFSWARRAHKNELRIGK